MQQGTVPVVASCRYPSKKFQPTDVLSFQSRAIGVATRNGHSLVGLADRACNAWGSNGKRQLGRSSIGGPTPETIQLPGQGRRRRRWLGALLGNAEGRHVLGVLHQCQRAVGLHRRRRWAEPGPGLHEVMDICSKRLLPVTAVQTACYNACHWHRLNRFLNMLQPLASIRPNLDNALDKFAPRRWDPF